LAAAMRIGREQYGLDLLESELNISIPGSRHRKKIVDSHGGIVTTTRIGLSMGGDHPYRFYLADHPCVSVRAKG
ncbi:DNA-3-methyladenine glycosylase, partial [bacterium]|nr:DNA-3-methyladenine glycosylase [bacterium]